MLLQCVLLWIFVLGIYCQENVPQVTTYSGEIVGYYNKSDKGNTFSAFEGIPFAKPPVGDRRFKEPEPIEPWFGTLNATFLVTCVQRRYDTSEIIGDEDCLYLNVYVPRETINPRENLPVIVHIHAGSFMYLSGHAYAKPYFIMDKDAILVTFNYRLGVLGFLSTEDDVVPGNNGLKDQAMALQWIKDNIERFGGNSLSVTITGIQAGGSSVHLHYFSDRSKDLFHKGLSQSGTALNPFAIQKNTLEKAKILADAVGCPTTNTKELVDCLIQRPVEHILDKLTVLYHYRFMPFVTFGPVIEKEGRYPFLKADPYELLRKGDVHDLPWMASVVSQDGLFPVEYFIDNLPNINDNWEVLAPELLDYSNTLDPSQWADAARKIKKEYMGDKSISKKHLSEFVKIFTDRYYLMDAEIAIEMQANANMQQVYFYMFEYPGSNQLIVRHGADARYFFGPINIPGHIVEPRPLTKDERIMKDMLLDMLISFARHGKPEFKGVEQWGFVRNFDPIYLQVAGVKPESNKMVDPEHWLTNHTSVWRSLKLLEGEHLYLEKQKWSHLFC